ncbi:CsiV family protein [Gilvimarinus agarilyticus]|uniref:CsiV family protein n=1 Tax=Gilvimarinus agarilyticus TaxID=679259 RepID=UPI0005A19D31|nr:CsiV family protein [Gilvimarinus agarilyticus]
MKVRAALFIALLLSGNLCVAQGTFEGWYQIEMIVYSRPPQNSVEQWPKNIELNYPLNWQQLYDPDAPATQIGNAAAPEDAAVDLDRTPFYKLPRDARNLNSVSDRLNAQPGFNVLFHEAWRQIVVGEDRAPSVLVYGGESYGEHNELEGSVNINVSRYLHIKTNLWVSQFQTNAGQSRNQWPLLPQQPQKRIAQQAQSEQDDNFFGRSSGSFSESGTGTNSLVFNDTNLNSALGDFFAAPYVTREIITMAQTRRMRSDELHFLDHPRMGVLIKVLPYTPPQAL